jgi:hypothetical protein
MLKSTAMNDYHAQELAQLICQKWDLQETLSHCDLSLLDRLNISNSLVAHAYHIARIMDLYQNPLIKFGCKGKIYDRYSDVIKDAQFDHFNHEVLVGRMFELAHTNIEHIIDVELKNESYYCIEALK